MFKDKWFNFQKMLAYGLDWDFVIFDVIVLSSVDMWFHSTMIAAVVAYVLDHMLLYGRGYFGKRNIAQSTLTDEKFLT